MDAPSADGDADLLELEFDTLWAVDTTQSLVPAPSAPQQPAPLVAIASTTSTIRTAYAAQVPRATRIAVDRIVASMEPSTHPGWEPDATAAVVGVVSTVLRTGAAAAGPSYLVTAPSDAPRGVVVTSTDTDRAQLAGRMPEDDRLSLTAPWAVVMDGDEVAAVCETARSTPSAVEAGVWTYEAHRRRGHASTATAAWAALVANRTAFYSTSWDNAGSQGVARRLGFHLLGQIWRVLPGEISSG